MVVKLFFDDRCFKRIYCREDNVLRLASYHCLLHACDYYGKALMDDFFPIEERIDTLFEDYVLVRVTLGKGYHFEYYV